ncbi:hypothetical protein K493DRAFT_250847 [Basidiobolus meristosporus CBS 931.73]|uniref:Tetraspanin n=1 Tax=Basidiobolus meristosporus CBS 931.73 TaxID=1314790 RepID=A0A1Y1ZCA2_9FUNG|nr:hypothetical protein K493DRAFT_250847 [Basidiobolus meristosporus CBS 931.73]|eukprot:ORY07846.1 hypothetical protein K493DRAFT_250847 [Basidiobolus meristosporus CBS 931.73]
MISSNIRLSYFLLTLIFLTSGLVALGVASYFLATPYMRRAVVVTRDMILGGFFVGALTVVSSLIGFYASLRPVRRKNILVVFAWLIIFVICIELFLGAAIWFRSLNIRGSFSDKWGTWDMVLKVAFQEADNCCGYYNAQDRPADSATCHMASIPHIGCVDAIHIYTDNYLRNIYTCLFGFVAVDVFAFLACVVLIQARNDQERYEKGAARMVKSQYL